MLAVNFQHEQLAQQFRDRHSLTFPVLVDMDNTLLRQYGKGLPYNVLIDRKGNIRYSKGGMYGEDFVTLVEQCLAEEPS